MTGGTISNTVSAMISSLLLSLAMAASAAGNKPYLPSSVPVNFRPDESEGRLLSVGVNRMTVVSDWEDNFFSPQSERVGDNKVTASGVSVGLIRNKSPRYSEEWDFLAGSLDFRAVTRSYHSAVINKPVNVGAEGHGVDFGVRYLGGYSLAKSGLGESVTVDWTLAASLHALLFRLENAYRAESVDGLDANHYDERDLGVFLRPSLAVQPVFDFGKSFSAVPYFGLSTMAIGAHTEYQDTLFRRNGASGRLTSSDDVSGQVRGPEFVFGFDLAVRPGFLKGHRVLLGGALSKFYGGGNGDFSELHLAYSFPLGKKAD